MYKKKSMAYGVVGGLLLCIGTFMDFITYKEPFFGGTTLWAEGASLMFWVGVSTWIFIILSWYRGLFIQAFVSLILTIYACVATLDRIQDCKADLDKYGINLLGGSLAGDRVLRLANGHLNMWTLLILITGVFFLFLAAFFAVKSHSNPQPSGAW